MATVQSAPIMPAVILETDRLRLRSLLERDIEDVYTSCVDPELQRWIPLPAPGREYTRETAEHFCLNVAPAIRTGGDGQHWAMVDRESGGFTGSVALMRTQWPAMVTEIGYWVSPWGRGRGYAAEAVVAVSRWALDQGFQRVELKAATANTGSCRVAESAGFVREGTERNAMPLHEGRSDLAVFGLVPSDVRP
ncbi:acetyltransferase [Nocardiopsis terrae]|uniref:RimJ/RimL family protein N-acetyltransferase n=1 Tax=Nocardiopsis terrae TaxID=372655 RepID=A0ABR9HD64_9ACTN|nr:GNAT family protein [Nocardiopsis terrae]MBE1456983.1 RimJ/RimL family protein N-acetyltransferase [Nocardiopsis terrae]GHC89970.1 acetyltransferase [Nocardiopsis terrae]